MRHLIMIADKHQGGTAPCPEHAEHGVERLDRQAAARMPEVTWDVNLLSAYHLAAGQQGISQQQDSQLHDGSRLRVKA
jgi:hypothetical protein